jgi:hypothetical protein
MGKLKAYKAMVGILLLAAITACETPREVERAITDRQNAQELRQGAVSELESRIGEIDEQIGSINTEIRNRVIGPEEQAQEQLNVIEEKRMMLGQRVSQYNTAVMAGNESEAVDLKNQIDRDLIDIENDIESLRRRMERLIN